MVKLPTSFALALAFAVATATAQPERPIRINKKEKKEATTQALEPLPEPPSAIAAETARLLFHVSPLSNKGLLSQQIRDAIKAIDKANGGATLIKIRAFVSGTGDLRRVQQIVSEDFADKRLPLPAVSTVQVGALPDGAQVVIEAASMDKRTTNPSGLAFFSGTREKDVEDSVKRLQDTSTVAGVQPAGMLRITCFLHSLDGAVAARKQLAAAFPSASLNLVQLTRLGVEPLALCEAVGRLTSPPADSVSVRSGVALVKAPKIVFTGIQMSFRAEDADLRLSQERLRKTMDAAKSTDVLFVSSYALTRGTAERSDALRVSSLGNAPGTSLVLEGLPSLDAIAAIEAIGAIR